MCQAYWTQCPVKLNHIIGGEEEMIQWITAKFFIRETAQVIKILRKIKEVVDLQGRLFCCTWFLMCKSWVKADLHLIIILLHKLLPKNVKNYLPHSNRLLGNMTYYISRKFSQLRFLVLNQNVRLKDWPTGLLLAREKYVSNQLLLHFFPSCLADRSSVHAYEVPQNEECDSSSDTQRQIKQILCQKP